MRVDPSDPEAEKPVGLDEAQDLRIGGFGGLRQALQGFEKHLPTAQAAQRQFTDDVRMN